MTALVILLSELCYRYALQIEEVPSYELRSGFMKLCDNKAGISKVLHVIDRALHIIG